MIVMKNLNNNIKVECLNKLAIQFNVKDVTLQIAFESFSLCRLEIDLMSDSLILVPKE